jgi:hypothetical protein
MRIQDMTDTELATAIEEARRGLAGADTDSISAKRESWIERLYAERDGRHTDSSAPARDQLVADTLIEHDGRYHDCVGGVWNQRAQGRRCDVYQLAERLQLVTAAIDSIDFGQPETAKLLRNAARGLTA